MEQASLPSSDEGKGGATQYYQLPPEMARDLQAQWGVQILSADIGPSNPFLRGEPFAFWALAS